MSEMVANWIDRCRRFSPQFNVAIRIARRVLLPLFVIALVYVAYGMVVEFPRIEASLAGLPTAAVLYAGLAAMLGVAARAGYRLALYDIAGYGRVCLPWRIALQSFAWGQLLRYVPGKIAGPATEVVLLQRYL